MQLIQEGNPEDKPVAVHYRHKRHLFVLKMRRAPYIEIDTSVMDTLDTLICEFGLHLVFLVSSDRYCSIVSSHRTQATRSSDLTWWIQNTLNHSIDL